MKEMVHEFLRFYRFFVIKYCFDLRYMNVKVDDFQHAMLAQQKARVEEFYFSILKGTNRRMAREQQPKRKVNMKKGSNEDLFITEGENKDLMEVMVPRGTLRRN